MTTRRTIDFDEMTLDDYQLQATRSKPPMRPLDQALQLGALGLTGEAGEVADIVKKHVYHGHELDRINLVKELGDVLWYVAYTAERLGVSLQEVAEINIAKLKARYPNGFESTRSIDR